MKKFFAEQAKQNPQCTPPSELGLDDRLQPSTSGAHPAADAPKLAPGVVLGKDGKPCRTCMSASAWKTLTKQSRLSQPPSQPQPQSSSSTLPSSSPSIPLLSNPPTLPPQTPQPPPDCPPDVSTLGTHTWTLLHSIAAAYPPTATPPQQSEMRQFLHLFATLYPCWVCADDFRTWMQRPGNAPPVEGRARLGWWMCEAHNEVNRKLGKDVFDCGRWEERWRTGRGKGGEERGCG